MNSSLPSISTTGQAAKAPILFGRGRVLFTGVARRADGCFSDFFGAPGSTVKVVCGSGGGEGVRDGDGDGERRYAIALRVEDIIDR